MSLSGLARLSPTELERARTGGDDVARCPYCSLYGPIGNCRGCGAPNVPVYRPTTRETVVELVSVRDGRPEMLGALPIVRFPASMPCSPAIDDVWPNVLIVDEVLVGPVGFGVETLGLFAWAWDAPRAALVGLRDRAAELAPDALIELRYTSVGASAKPLPARCPDVIWK